MKRRLALAFIAVALVGVAVSVLATGAPARTAIVAASVRFPSVSLSIVHVLRGCHVWMLGSKDVGPRPVVTVKAGTRLKLRVSCPMDFELTQTAGPKVALGPMRFYQGSTRVVVLKKAGLYRFLARNLQTSDEVGLQTLGDDNALKLTVRVR